MVTSTNSSPDGVFPELARRYLLAIEPYVDPALLQIANKTIDSVNILSDVRDENVTGHRAILLRRRLQLTGNVRPTARGSPARTATR
jgi:hypothetical protein